MKWSHRFTCLHLATGNTRVFIKLSLAFQPLQKSSMPLISCTQVHSKCTGSRQIVSFRQIFLLNRSNSILPFTRSRTKYLMSPPKIRFCNKTVLKTFWIPLVTVTMQLNRCGKKIDESLRKHQATKDFEKTHGMSILVIIAHLSMYSVATTTRPEFFISLTGSQISSVTKCGCHSQQTQVALVRRLQAALSSSAFHPLSCFNSYC